MKAIIRSHRNEGMPVVRVNKRGRQSTARQVTGQLWRVFRWTTKPNGNMMNGKERLLRGEPKSERCFMWIKIGDSNYSGNIFKGK